MRDAVRFEVVTPAASAAARRLTTAAYCSALLDDPPSDTALETHIDEVSAVLARVCRLASDGTNVATFATETCRATWFQAWCYRGDKLLLPWRPGAAVSSVVENGTTLTVDTDYVVLPGGVLQRLMNDLPIPWSYAKIVATYTAGWSLPSGTPSDLQGAVAEQVRYRVLSQKRDPSLRSESVPDAYSGSYSVAGGDSISPNGLLISVERAFDPYRGEGI